MFSVYLLFDELRWPVVVTVEEEGVFLWADFINLTIVGEKSLFVCAVSRIMRLLDEWQPPGDEVAT